MLNLLYFVKVDIRTKINNYFRADEFVKCSRNNSLTNPKITKNNEKIQINFNDVLRSGAIVLL